MTALVLELFDIPRKSGNLVCVKKGSTRAESRKIWDIGAQALAARLAARLAGPLSPHYEQVLAPQSNLKPPSCGGMLSTADTYWS